MTCNYKHSSLAVTTKGRVLCLHCKETFSAEKLMTILIKAQQLSFIQMHDCDIWKNFETNPEAEYIRDQLGKMHCILEDMDL